MFNNLINFAENLGYWIIDKEPPKKNNQKTTINTDSEIEKKIPASDTPSIHTKNGYIFYVIKTFRENEFGIAYWQAFLKNFFTSKNDIIFTIEGNRQSIKIYAGVPAGEQHYFENIFNSNFPTSDLEMIEPFDIRSNKSYLTFTETTFFDDSHFKRDGVFFDPIKDILTIFDPIDDTAKLRLTYTYRFHIKESNRDYFVKIIGQVFSIFNIFSVFSKKPVEEKKEEGKSTEPVIKTHISIGITTTNTDTHIEKNIMNNLKSQYNKYVEKGKIDIKPQQKFSGLTVEQASLFFHLPTKEYFIKSLDYAVYRKLPYPANVPTIENTEKNGITLLGYTDYKNQTIKFGIRTEDKLRHMYILGKTGTGKSTFISNMVKSDMITNKGLCLIDPHGDLIDTALEHVPSRRTNDVVLFDISDYNNPIGFNLLQYSKEEEKTLVISGVVSTFKKLYGTSRGPRLEYILRNLVMTIVEYPNATLLAMLRVLNDKPFREEVLTYVQDPNLLKFWRGEFDKWQENMKQEAINPIVNKVGQFLSSPIVRNIFGQPSSKLNFRKIMDEGKILLVNLSKGKIGDDNTQMIGSFLVTKMQIDAMSRADMAFKDRKEFYLYIDEFQNFATESFAVIFSEARKYKLSLIVANQFLSQLEDIIKNAVFGNVGTIIPFTLGYDDAKIMSSQFKELITPNDLISLPRFKAYIKLMIEGITSDPFSMRTLPLASPELSEEIKEKMRIQSRQRYGMDRVKLEELIKAWTNKTFSATEKVMEKVMAEQKSQEIGTTNQGGEWLTIEKIEIGKTYNGYVKLKYNYGIFVTVQGVEGLLHKNSIVDPAPNVDWKDFYNIGDKISVKAESTKEINGEMKIVRTQK